MVRRRSTRPDPRRRKTRSVLAEIAAPANSPMNLLIDTCTFLWLGRGDRQVPSGVRSALESGADAWLSAASAWEIAIKHALGRLPLPVPLQQFVDTLRQRYQLKSLPVDQESALLVARLPPLHADPFDRLLVAQAIVHGMIIVTPDPAVTQYPARTMW
jgi:PIN domain nuclease of toxin-antitoxin system